MKNYFSLFFRRNSTMTFIYNSVSANSKITTTEFITALHHSCGDIWGEGGGQREVGKQEAKTLGLAISGGVDSMALAVLCSNIYTKRDINKCSSDVDHCNESNELSSFTFHAFIVDHRVRHKSRNDANSVAKLLRIRGIPTEILTMKWDIDQPSCLPNFETLARKKRFQLLGQACYELGINKLMLAHHQEDQAETIFMRLISGHRGKGLVGIKAQAAIPECYGLYGIHESGRREILQKQQENSVHSSSLSGFKLISETGGIQIIRPLLNFSKARLISTCKAYEMEWFEDSSNYDVTLTTRNAIRSLYLHHKMPAALSKSSLIKLAEKIKSRIKRQSDVIHVFLSRVHVYSFNLSSGTIKIRFPYFSHDDVENLVRSKDLMIFQLASELLCKIIALVTPRKHIELLSLQGVVHHVFPEIFQGLTQASSSPSLLSKKKLKDETQKQSFTISGVLFQQIDKSAREMVKSSNLSSQCCSNQIKETWLISRQPISQTSMYDSMITIPVVTKITPSWVLFDGRFWIKIHNFSQSHNLVVRFLSPEDMKLFSDQLESKVKKKLRSTLSELAPDKVRWTLPLIALHENGTDFIDSKPLSLPTLGIDVPGAGNFGAWEVRYKRVYTDYINIP